MATATLKAVLLGEDRSMSKTFRSAGKEADNTKGKMGHLRGELKGLGKGSGSLKGVMGGAFKDIGGAASSLGMAGGPLGMVAGGVVAIGAAAAAVIVPFAESSISAFKGVATETLKMQRIMGGTAEEASRMRFAFHETGIDADTGAKGIAMLSKNLDKMGPKTKMVTRHVEVATGAWKKQTTIVKDAAGHFHKLEKMVPVTKMKTFKEAVSVVNPVLAKLGINARDAQGHIRPMADLLPELAEKFKSMPNGPEKTATAMKLFGKAGTAMLPFLNKGKDGLAELAKKSDEYGLTLTGKNLQSMKDAKAAQRDMDAAVLGLKVRFGSDLLPMLTKVVLWFTAKVIPALVKAGKWWHDHQDTITKVCAVIGAAIVVGWKMMGGVFSAMGTAIHIVGAVFTWLWNNAVQPAIHFILGGIAMLDRKFADLLDGLSHVPGFGWAKGAADKMRGAADAADRVSSALRKIPTNTDVNIRVHTSGGRIRLPNGTTYNVGQRAAGGPTRGGRQYLVGENGPELWSESSDGHITPARQTAQMFTGGGSSSASGSSDDERPIVVQMMLDGRVVQEVLLKRKRQQGNRPLGLA